MLSGRKHFNFTVMFYLHAFIGFQSKAGATFLQQIEGVNDK